jgi:hypothetical protein
MFPFKLADYRKRLLSKPTAVAALHYSESLRSLPTKVTRIPMTASGRCDCVAVWVDYDIAPVRINSCESSSSGSSSGVGIAETGSIEENASSSLPDGASNIIRQFQSDKSDFACHAKSNVKFFPSAVNVQEGLSVLSCSVEFQFGDSDFRFDFQI